MFSHCQMPSDGRFWMHQLLSGGGPCSVDLAECPSSSGTGIFGRCCHRRIRRQTVGSLISCIISGSPNRSVHDSLCNLLVMWSPASARHAAISYKRHCLAALPGSKRQRVALSAFISLSRELQQSVLLNCTHVSTRQADSFGGYRQHRRLQGGGACAGASTIGG